MIKQVVNENGIPSDVVMQPNRLNRPTEKQRKSIKPFNLIPNVRKFKVHLAEYDPMFLKHGIDKRLEPTFEYEKFKNHRANRFIKGQLERLRRHSSNPDIYWTIAKHIIRRSNTFLMSSINHVIPKWHRNMSLSSVIKLAISTRRIATYKESKLEVKRIYIKKSNGKLRPLGVPALPGRVYLNMLNNMITFYLENIPGGFHNSQHGFRPNRGTKTAGEFIMTEVLKSPDIFEFDLKGYFDSINLAYISQKLRDKLIPEDIIELIYYINSTGVITKSPYLLNEFEHKIKDLVHKGSSYEDIVKAQDRHLSTIYSGLRGVPQGSPLSPMLASLAMEGSILDRPGLKSLAYADDGLYYGKIDQPIITPNTGMVKGNIKFNLDKSGGVKRNGTGIKPLKFLGMQYGNGILSANTRKGSTMKFNKGELIKDQNVRIGEDSHSPWGYESDERSGEALLKSKLGGFIQSRLYAGAGNMEEFIQSFEYTFKAGTGSSKKGKGKNINVFNSTSYASHWMIKKLSTLKAMRLL